MGLSGALFLWNNMESSRFGKASYCGEKKKFLPPFCHESAASNKKKPPVEALLQRGFLLFLANCSSKTGFRNRRNRYPDGSYTPASVRHTVPASSLSTFCDRRDNNHYLCHSIQNSHKRAFRHSSLYIHLAAYNVPRSPRWGVPVSSKASHCSGPAKNERP